MHAHTRHFIVSPTGLSSRASSFSSLFHYWWCASWLCRAWFTSRCLCLIPPHSTTYNFMLHSSFHYLQLHAKEGFIMEVRMFDIWYKPRLRVHTFEHFPRLTVLHFWFLLDLVEGGSSPVGPARAINEDIIVLSIACILYSN